MDRNLICILSFTGYDVLLFHRYINPHHRPLFSVRTFNSSHAVGLGVPYGPFNSSHALGLGSTYGPLIPHMFLASVHRTFENVLKGNINLEYSILDSRQNLSFSFVDDLGQALKKHQKACCRETGLWAEVWTKKSRTRSCICQTPAWNF